MRIACGMVQNGLVAIPTVEAVDMPTLKAQRETMETPVLGLSAALGKLDVERIAFFRTGWVEARHHEASLQQSGVLGLIHVQSNLELGFVDGSLLLGINLTGNRDGRIGTMAGYFLCLIIGGTVLRRVGFHIRCFFIVVVLLLLLLPCNIIFDNKNSGRENVNNTNIPPGFNTRLTLHKIE